MYTCLSVSENAIVRKLRRPNRYLTDGPYLCEENSPSPGCGERSMETSVLCMEACHHPTHKQPRLTLLPLSTTFGIVNVSIFM